jgi:epoxyqueuosine reductase
VADNKDVMSFRELAESEARAAGFDLCGVSPVDALPELSYFPEWVAAGKAGEMRYLEARNEAGQLKRANLRSAAPWARSVIVCAVNYNSAQPYSTDPAPAGSGWISRYAWFENTDYHDAILRRLRDVEAKITTAWSEPIRTWCYVDTGPVVERVYAKYAGLGWIAKNTCVINEEKGSWLFLGVILTSAALQAGEYPLPAADRCGSCTRCIEACPTNAIVEPYKLDPRLCISYLTIEKRDEIPNELRSGTGRNIFGCDICQDVCPWNGGVAEHKRPVATTLPEFAVRDELVNPNLERLARMLREEFQQLFRGSPVKRAKYEGLLRNVAVAMGNSGRTEFLPLLEELAAGESAVVAEHARWSIDQLTRNQVVKSSH